MLKKQEQRVKRHKRIRAKVKGASSAPRLCVFRSNQHIYAQLINDEKGIILESSGDFALKIDGKVKKAFEVGQAIAQKALSKKIDKVIFDRGGYKYHGRVKAVADGARAAGLKF
ncbi:MAG: 50S ribosomal protein L18 [Patescibacteria group bacterium]